MWVRGLKREDGATSDDFVESHPVWVRGLKRTQFSDFALPEYVAPRVGAWIETQLGTLELLDNPCRTPCGCVD